jgi:pimeloyl-ACP methyl ester carboxylesterase
MVPLRAIVPAVLAALPALFAQGSSARLAVPGGEIAYDVTGPPSAPAVVLLHGAFMDRRSWDRQVPAFAKQFRVVRLDLRPFGESMPPREPYSVPDDVRLLLDHLRIERAHLMGHSFGGGVAIDFALVYPDRVASLVLVSANPSGFGLPEDERKAGMAIFAAVKDGDEAIVDAWVAHPMWAVARERPALKDELAAITRRNLAPFRMKAPPYRPLTPPAVGRLADVKTPTLIVVGDRDTPGNQQASALMAKQIAGAKAVVIPGADHAVPLGWSDALNSAALDFMLSARR